MTRTECGRFELGTCKVAELKDVCAAFRDTRDDLGRVDFDKVVQQKVLAVVGAHGRLRKHDVIWISEKNIIQREIPLL